MRKKYRFISMLAMASLMTVNFACKDQLEVGNPNSPTVKTNVTSVSGLTSLAQGVVYIDGFVDGDGWLGNSYFSLPYGYQELLGDMVGAITALNQNINRIGQPNYFTLSDGTKVVTGITNLAEMRDNNTRARTGSGYNATYYQWLNMYAMNAGCNQVLSLIENVTQDPDMIATYKAWVYWWKGYAYASIGSMYYSGLIIDDVYGSKSSDYVTHDVVIDRSNFYFNLAATTLDGIANTSTYTTVLTSLIPAFTQTGNGGVPTVAQWKRNINTMLARNIVSNHLAPFINGNPSATITGATAPAMTAADWTQVLTLATNGIQATDKVFTGRAIATNGFFTPTGGTVAALSIRSGPTATSTFNISERFIQNFKPGDARLANFSNDTPSSHTFFGTRYRNTDGLVAAGIYDYGSRNANEYELFIAGSYEENLLLLAEANIRLGNIDAGVAQINSVRTRMGAGIAALPTGLTLAEAMQELVMERRVALAFRGVSFYDLRRWGMIYDIAKGGGSYGNTMYYNGAVQTNVTINYNFLDYWDVPADESQLNPSATAVATVNPNF
jgi:starch-binding outer membrane protein, SusD/RagB family